MKRWIIHVTWAASICGVMVLSIAPPDEVPLSVDGADKIAHCLAYAWLAVLPFFSFEKTRTAFVAALLMIPYGIALEFAQQVVPGRDCSLADMAADAAGVFLGIAGATCIKERPWFGSLGCKTGKTAP